MGERLSVVVAAWDEEEMLPGCLRRLEFADEVVVVVDDRTVDATAEVAAAGGARVVSHRFSTFSDLKNAGIAAATGEWILVVDADERVTAALASEVRTIIGRGFEPGHPVAYEVPIENWFFARRIRFGGWRERPVRLFRRGAARYRGEIHETLGLGDQPVAVVTGGLAHFSHRSINHNLAKTAYYADVQAAAMLAAGHRRVTMWTLLRVMAGQAIRRLVLGQGWRDGMPGFIEGVYQPFSMFAVYVRLWELQQQPSLEEQYRLLEERVT